MYTTTTKKILLVDDNPVMLAVLAGAFLNEGFAVMQAASAHEALKVLENQIPDVILSDYEMPDMNGFGFRKRLLANAPTRDIPFVFLTFYNNSDLVMKGLDELLAVDFIDKETPMPVIVAKMDNLIATVRKKQALSLEELRKAAEAINVRSIPSYKPKITGFDIDFWHQAYRGYPGGDFIDFVQPNDRYLFIALGDVMGKKWTAWFFTFSFLSYVRAALRFCVLGGEYSPALVLQKVNYVVCQDDLLKDVLASVSLVLLDKETGQVAYSGAGDLPLLHYKAADNSINTVQSTGLLLGLFGNATYDIKDIDMNTGDQLLIFSDGVIDFSENGKRRSNYNLFTQKLHPNLQMKNSFSAICNYLQEQLDGGKQTDDCSIISITKN